MLFEMQLIGPARFSVKLVSFIELISFVNKDSFSDNRRLPQDEM